MFERSPDVLASPLHFIICCCRQEKKAAVYLQERKEGSGKQEKGEPRREEATTYVILKMEGELMVKKRRMLEVEFLLLFVSGVWRWVDCVYVQDTIPTPIGMVSLFVCVEILLCHKMGWI